MKLTKLVIAVGENNFLRRNYILNIALNLIKKARKKPSPIHPSVTALYRF